MASCTQSGAPRLAGSMARMAMMLMGAMVGALPASGADWHERVAKPSPEFSQLPFWFWNDDLTEQEILRQLADFREHGVYGFVIHGRMGLAKSIPYMGDRWMQLVRTAVEEAARTNMRVCLYDEGMYPSGSAHGKVAQSNPAFAACGLAMESMDIQGPATIPVTPPAGADVVAMVLGKRTGEKETLDGESLRAIDVSSAKLEVPPGNWRLMTFTCVPSHGRIRGVHEGEEDSEAGAPPAADLLNPQAMQAFIQFAYEPYYAALGKHYGKTVIGMFTDEPSMLGRRPRSGLKPWTTGFAAYFQNKRGYSATALLPGLFVGIGPKTEGFRRDVASTLAERLDETYYQPLSQWCEAHGIALTGHPAGATEIQPLRFFQIPGQDIVWRGVAPEGNKALQGTNSAIGKCSSSVARHDGRLRNSNEVYGAFGWQLTLEEMKWLADWLMVRGVNLLYPHAFYYSIREYRVNERPPDLGPNNLWWPHYRWFADYTARVCGLLVGSRQICNVAILGGNHALPWRAAEFLYRHQVDFNYIEDWRLVGQARIQDGRIAVGDMAYDLLIVDGDRPPTGAVAETLVRFQMSGGKVRYCTGAPDPTLLDGLERDVRISPEAPALRYTHVVKDGVDFYLLVNEGESEMAGRLTVRRAGRAEWLDAWTGAFAPAEAAPVDADGLSVGLHLERRASIILCVDPGKPMAAPTAPHAGLSAEKPVPLGGPWEVVDRDGKRMVEGLGDWQQQPATAGYAGTLTYRTHFEMAKREGIEYAIDLGAVGDFATLTLNGQVLPVRFWAPYRWMVTPWLKEGRNELSVEVTNSLVNRYDAKIRRASGLIGPVEILPMTRSTSPLTSTSRPARSIRVAAIQMLPGETGPGANVARAEALVREAVTQHGAQVLVLPECTVPGYVHPDEKMTLAQVRQFTEPVTGPSVDHFARLAHELNVHIVLGLHEQRGDKHYNTAVLLSPEGRTLGTYSKVHINKYEGEMGWTNGDGFRVWPCRVGEVTLNIGIMICFDREVPEAARCLAVLGADLILVPQATSCTSRFPIHRDQLRVRAFENEVYLAMANWAGPSFQRHSMLIHPHGEVLKLGTQQEEILLADMDMEALGQLREAGIYGKHHRQPGAYASLVADSKAAPAQ